jgi:outer membrane immunogenic protein
MKRFVFAAVGLLAIAAALPAAAADLPRREMPYKAPAYVTAYNWTGFYLGINGGFGWGDSDWSGFGASNKPTGGMVGGTVGYNWQGAGSPWVLGVEGDVDWANIKDNTVCGGTVCETKNTWFGTARGRVGYSFDRFLPYVTAGAAFGGIDANRAGFAGASDSTVGWTVGAGIEGAIADRWTAKIEYLYADIGDISCSAAACGVPTNVDLRLNVLRGGLNYRF